MVDASNPVAGAATKNKPERFRDRLSVTTIAATIALVGALWYGLMSFLTAWVYDPVGVEPHEVGLSSSSLLAQATSGLVALLLLSLVVWVIVALVFTLVSWMREEDLSGAAHGSLAWWEHRYAMFVLGLGLTLIWTGTLYVLLAPFVVGKVAWDARSSIQDAERQTLLWGLLPAPWRGEIAYVTPLAADSARPQNGDSVGALPSCALYLGQAEGTTVLVYRRTEAGRTVLRTLRLPSSSVRLELRPNMDRCPTSTT